MKEPIPVATDGLVLHVPTARRAVLHSDLSPTQRLVLLALLEVTEGAAASVTRAKLASMTALNVRTIVTAVAELAGIGLIITPSRGRVEWSRSGPLAAAWVTPGPRREPTFRTSSFTGANAGVSRPLEREERAALEALEVAHDELRTRRGYLPDPAKWGDATPEALRTVARWTLDGAQRVGMTVPAFALCAMRHWFELPGSSGVLARTGHPLAMLLQGGRCTDLAEVGRRVAAARLAYQRDDAAPLGPPAMSREELAARAAELAATVGRRVA